MKHKLIFPQSQPYIEATEAHKGQLRKYTMQPYISHPIAVAELVYSVLPDINMVGAALLHDVVADTHVTLADIFERESFLTARLVQELTEFSFPEDGNRAFRKNLDLRYLERATPQAKLIKLADLLHNSETIIKYGGGFAPIFIGEMESLLRVLCVGGLPEAKSLEEACWGVVSDFRKSK